MIGFRTEVGVLAAFRFTPLGDFKYTRVLRHVPQAASGVFGKQ